MVSILLPLLGILIAVPLGIVALVKMSGTRMKGRWMAIAGIVISVLWWVGIITFGVILATQEADRNAAGDITKAGRIEFGDIVENDCIDIPGLDNNAEIDTFDLKGVPCADAHNAETVSIIPISGSSYPGQSELNSQANQPCVSAVSQVPGITAREYQPYILLPNEDLWDSDNGHRVICFVVKRDFSDMTGIPAELADHRFPLAPPGSAQNCHVGWPGDGYPSTSPRAVVRCPALDRAGGLAGVRAGAGRLLGSGRHRQRHSYVEPAQSSGSTEAPTDSPTTGPADLADLPEGFGDGPPGTGLQRFVDQDVSWEPCEGGECADIWVPLDYDDPDGLAITLKAKRQTATDDAKRRGSLFINPGGPGESGIDYLGFIGLPDNVRAMYDVVGFDPRGVGEQHAGRLSERLRPRRLHRLRPDTRRRRRRSRSSRTASPRSPRAARPVRSPYGARLDRRGGA